mmetsp:Transcript_8104/g.18042  ORF Transcript_8104/g.18042 Transcript_8104/m.18042 type:complete len:242 (+) Transcript_8104:76-801(+)
MAMLPCTGPRRRNCVAWAFLLNIATSALATVSTATDASTSTASSSSSSSTEAPQVTVATPASTTTTDLSWMFAEDCSVGYVTAGYDIYPDGIECQERDRLTLQGCAIAVSDLSGSCRHLPLTTGSVATDTGSDPAEGCYVRYRGSATGVATSMNFVWGVPPYWQYYTVDIRQEFHAVCSFSSASAYFSRNWSTQSPMLASPQPVTRAPSTGIINSALRQRIGRLFMVLALVHVVIKACSSL